MVSNPISTMPIFVPCGVICMLIIQPLMQQFQVKIKFPTLPDWAALHICYFTDERFNVGIVTTKDEKTMQDKLITYGLERTIYTLSVSKYAKKFEPFLTYQILLRFTPLYPSQTPFYPSRTPFYPSQISFVSLRLPYSITSPS